MLRLCFALLPLLLVSAVHAAEVRDYTYFLNQLIDLDGLALVQEGVTCAQASSYDRASRYDAETGEYIEWSANSDAGQYIRQDATTKEGVMAELEGPGCIFRIWSANPDGVIRFYLDGDTEPTYEFSFDKFFSGEIEPFVRPLVWQRKVVLGGGNPASNCYVPIPFAKSCRVTSVVLDENGQPERAPGHYYHIGYKLYPKDWRVETFRLPLSAKSKRTLADVARKWNDCGRDPQVVGRPHVKDATFEVEPGATATIFDLTGPATIRQFYLKIESDDPFATRNAVLRAFWDGEESPSILTPLGDFFGRAVGAMEYRSLPLGMANDMDYSYWRMPFRRHGTLTVENQGPSVLKLTAKFVYTTARVPDNAAYFHAKWRNEPHSTTFDYPFVECSGSAGTFVGDLLAIDNFVGGWWGEGDEKFYVDGEKFPSTFGTGSEDYYGDAWGIVWFVNPYHGCPQNEGRKQVCYRWHISDSVPFSSSFMATIENYSAFNSDMQNGYASVAYWYQMAGGDDFFPKELPPAVERRPSPEHIVQGAVEAEDVLAEAPGAKVLDAPETYDTFSAGRAVELGTGEVGVQVPVETTTDDVYSVRLYSAFEVPLSSEKALVLLDGQPVRERIYLPGGSHTFTLRASLNANESLVLDYFLVEPYRNYITDWLILGPFDNADGAGHAEAYAPEERLDFTGENQVVGGTARWKPVKARGDGCIDLDRPFKPNSWVVAYAAIEVVSPEECDTELLAGSDDGIKIWLNGELVHDNFAVRGFTPDEDRTPIHLKQGTNTLLVKISEQEGFWGFSVRIVDPDGTLEYKLPATGGE
ncbi:MAG: DUF2961 domain-containing protein [Verrucomicrobia bacterium]|nr:DUF2961 domain-containing protein [Verrucomicrobiota bacterium]